MGGSEGKLKERFLYSIMANKEGECNNLLQVSYKNLFTLTLIPNKHLSNIEIS